MNFTTLKMKERSFFDELQFIEKIFEYFQNILNVGCSLLYFSLTDIYGGCHPGAYFYPEASGAVSNFSLHIVLELKCGN